MNQWSGGRASVTAYGTDVVHKIWSLTTQCLKVMAAEILQSCWDYLNEIWMWQAQEEWISECLARLEQVEWFHHQVRQEWEALRDPSQVDWYKKCIACSAIQWRYNQKYWLETEFFRLPCEPSVENDQMRSGWWRTVSLTISSRTDKANATERLCKNIVHSAWRCFARMR